MKRKDVINQYQLLGTQDCLSYLVAEHQSLLADPSLAPTKQAYGAKLRRLVNQYNKLIKSKHRASNKAIIDKFLGQDFVFPSARPRPQQSQPIAGPSSIVEQRSDMLRVGHRLKIRKSKVPKADTQKLVEALNVRLAQKNKELKRKGSKIKHLKSKTMKLQQTAEQMVEKHTETETNLNEELRVKQTTHEDVIAENDWLREMIKDEVKSKDDAGVYTQEMKECVFSLLNHNVPTGQIPAVIESVLKLAGKTTEVPSKSSINDWNIMRLILAQRQLAEEVPQKSNLGLLSDETSKFGRKFEGFHLSDAEGRFYVLGLRDITSKSGQDVLNTFKQILCDIDDMS